MIEASGEMFDALAYGVIKRASPSKVVRSARRVEVI